MLFTALVNSERFDMATGASRVMALVGHRTLRVSTGLGDTDRADGVECPSGPISHDQRLAAVLNREEQPKRASLCVGVNTSATVMPLRAAFWPSL
jgi:hypothetical protein